MFCQAIPFRYNSGKVLESTFKVTGGIFSGTSMYVNGEPKSILSSNNMLLQYGLMSNSACHYYWYLKSSN